MFSGSLDLSHPLGSMECFTKATGPLTGVSPLWGKLGFRILIIGVAGEKWGTLVTGSLWFQEQRSLVILSRLWEQEQSQHISPYVTSNSCVRPLPPRHLLQLSLIGLFEVLRFLLGYPVFTPVDFALFYCISHTHFKFLTTQTIALRQQKVRLELCTSYMLQRPQTKRKNKHSWFLEHVTAFI